MDGLRQALERIKSECISLADAQVIALEALNEDQLTVQDVLSLISQCAQSCRESGESDMRNILNAVRSIEADIAKGLSRDEILDSWKDEDDGEPA